jgi:uncharacterized phage-associated protein
MSHTEKINDVADFIICHLCESGVAINVLKLQKLLFYTQAWHMAFNEGKPLFEGEFQAWINGPVNREIYNRFIRSKGMYSELNQGDAISSSWESLIEKEKLHIREVLGVYGPLTDSQLVALTHREKPWIEARGGISEGERCENVINEQTMTNFYKAQSAQL